MFTSWYSPFDLCLQGEFQTGARRCCWCAGGIEKGKVLVEFNNDNLRRDYRSGYCVKCSQEYQDADGSEEAAGRIAGGSVVFRSPEGWSFTTATSDKGEVICNLTKEDGDAISLYSALDSNDTKDNFEQCVAAVQNKDFEKLPHRTLADWEFYVNNHKAFYRIMEYENENGQTFYRHIAVVFDSGTGRAVLLGRYSRDQDESIIKRLLQSIRFYK